jgi:hypothetical protein
MNHGNRTVWLYLCVFHAALVFCTGALLFVCKWFPYGPATRVLREWLYRFF